MENGRTPPPSVKAGLPELPLLLRELHRLELHNGVLYRQRQVGPDIIAQLVLPEELRAIALQSLLQMLGTLSQPEKLHCKYFVKPLVHDDNCTKNETTGFSSYKLTFGRQLRLPIDLAFGLPTNTTTPPHSQYVSDLKSRLEQSYKIATFTAQKNADHNKTRFDKRVVESGLEVGDRILVSYCHTARKT